MEQPKIFPGRIRLGMVGGGEGAFIGAVHRHAARLDDRYELLAGALSSSAEAARRSGLALGMDSSRIYDDYRQMAPAEASRADGIEAVVIVTPNHMHAPVARAFLEAGINVICDKPVTTSSDDARMLQVLAEERGLLFAVTHNYSAYPLVRHAQQMVREGALGKIRVVQVQYAQDWLAAPLEQDGHKQAAWRTDPAKSGGGAIGDIGSHAWHLADFITGLRLESVAAQLSSFVPGRAIDDDVQVMLRYEGGARGLLWASQVAVGCTNELRIRIVGSAGGIEWAQEQPNELKWTALGEPTRIITRGSAAMNAAGARTSRVPAGHPEGYIDAFGALYSEIACHLLARRDGSDPGAAQFPTIADGVRGVEFIEAVQASSLAGGAWIKIP
ncbi:Gfo/Idh/MocA family oxidoreductase [Duganella sp.]|uniref:Gfo/Idh/MocA family protein n=1 Tax=Duganella sp. TaxID=1904440 RepID=UPI0031E28A98